MEERVKEIIKGQKDHAWCDNYGDAQFNMDAMINLAQRIVDLEDEIDNLYYQASMNS